jgi:tRNA-Thr(GGU) m(6)t(6)A37 methyltransferase TsaA
MSLHLWQGNENMARSFKIYPISRIRKQDVKAWIEVDAPYQNAILGLDAFSHILVLYWLHENDIVEGRSMLQAHPQHNAANLFTGVFATHSPRRPKLIALRRCRVLDINGLRIDLNTIDARDNSPLIDIKRYIPPKSGDADVEIPDWVRRHTGAGSCG